MNTVLHNIRPFPRTLVVGAAFGAFLFIGSCSFQQPVKPTGERLSVQEGCSACHGVGGISDQPNFPNLAGQKESYITNQLTVFKIGAKSNAKIAWIAERYNGMMNAKASNLTGENIRQLARYFSSQPCAFGPRHVPPKAVPEKISTCKQCHGLDGISLRPDIPNLAGQKQPYLADQIEAFRRSSMSDEVEGNRRHSILMTPQAAELTDEEIQELSMYYSRLDCRGDAM